MEYGILFFYFFLAADRSLSQMFPAVSVAILSVFDPFSSLPLLNVVHYQVHLRCAHVPLSMRARKSHRIRNVRPTLHSTLFLTNSP